MHHSQIIKITEIELIIQIRKKIQFFLTAIWPSLGKLWVIFERASSLATGSFVMRLGP